MTNIYAQAIGDFIVAANKRSIVRFDTLFIGKRAYGQEDDFPDIKLPESIEHTRIFLLSPELAERKMKERPSRTYINLIGWIEEEKAEFIFIVFSNGFAHQYDYNIDYTYNVKQKKFELKNIQFKGPPFGR